MAGKKVTMKRFTGDGFDNIYPKTKVISNFQPTDETNTIDEKLINTPIVSNGNIGGMNEIDLQTINDKITILNDKIVISSDTGKIFGCVDVNNGSVFTARVYTSAAAVGTYIYIFGGTGSGDQIIKFDTLDNTATLVSGSNTSAFTARNNTSAAAVGTDIYIFGGYGYENSSDTTMGSLNQIIKFNTLDNTATLVSGSNTSAFTARRETSSAAVGTDIYVFGGYGSSGTLNEIIKFNTLDNTAIDISGSNTEAFTSRYATSSAAVGTDIYVFGGYGSSGTLNEIIKFNTLDNTATLVSGSSTSVFTTRTQTSAAAVGTDIYVFGGNSGNYLDDIIKTTIPSQSSILQIVDNELLLNGSKILTEKDIFKLTN